jgi:KTSC domain
MLIWHEVESTSIRAIGYDPDTHEAFVEFLRRPGPYVYKGVPPKIYAGLERADRKGPYVNRVIKKYPYEHRERWPKSRPRPRSRG